MKIEHVPSVCIAYVRQVGPYAPRHHQTMENIKSWAEANSLLDEQAIILGISQDPPESTPPENGRYDAGIVISDEQPLDGSVREGILPAGLYPGTK